MNWDLQTETSQEEITIKKVKQHYSIVLNTSFSVTLVTLAPLSPYAWIRIFGILQF